MSLIELGDVSSEADGGPHRVTEFRHGTVRRLMLAALVVLCVVTLGASARPAPPLIRELWSVPLADPDRLAVLGDVVLVHRFAETRTELSGYDAGTGRVLWTQQVDAHTGPVEAVARSGVLLLTEGPATSTAEPGDGGATVPSPGGTIAAVDAATGATLWRRTAGYHLSAGPETVLLAEPGGPGMPPTLRLVRTMDGGIIWERAVPGASEMLVQQDRIVLASLDGAVTVLDHGDGTPLLTRRLPWTRQDNGTGSGTSITVTNGRLLVTRMAGAAHSLTAYRIDTLERLWSTDSPRYIWGDDCGPVICLTSDDNRIRAVDPDTGTARWTVTGSPMTGLVPGNERFLVQQSDESPRPVLIEAATGQPIGQPGQGFVAFWSPVARSSALLLDPLAGDSTRAVVNRLDLTTGESTLLGTIDQGGNGRCDGTERFLACETADGRLAVNGIG